MVAEGRRGLGEGGPSIYKGLLRGRGVRGKEKGKRDEMQRKGAESACEFCGRDDQGNQPPLAVDEMFLKRGRIS